MGMVAGPGTLPGDASEVMATLDSEYRFINAPVMAAWQSRLAASGSSRAAASRRSLP
jgi:hypothetical protein